MEREPRVAFVLGGGGVLGAHEVGMLRALEETGVRPDLVVGTSIGALNGVFVAAGPGTAVERLTSLWSDESVREVFGSRVLARLWTLARSGTHLHSSEPLRRMLDELLPVSSFEELDVPYQCVAAGIGPRWRTGSPAARWSPRCSPRAPRRGCCRRSGSGTGTTSTAGSCTASRSAGPSCSAPPPSTSCTSGGSSGTSHRRAAVEVGLVAFEIARRHRFFEEMAALPDGLTVHVLPAGNRSRRAGVDLAQMRYRNGSGIQAHIERAYQASLEYLKERS